MSRPAVPLWFVALVAMGATVWAILALLRHVQGVLS